MSEENTSAWKKALKMPAKGFRTLGRGFSRGRVRLFNFTRRKAKIGYIRIPLSGSFPEREPAPPGFVQSFIPNPLASGPTEVSMQAHNARIARIIDADNVKGVIFALDGLAVSLPRLQSLRQGFERLKAADKEIVVTMKQVSIGKLFLASAADKIIVPPTGEFGVIGLYRQTLFLKDTFAELGIEFENFQISPYKSAADNLSKSEASPEYQEQVNWLMDEQYDLLTAGIAQGRGMTQVQVQAIIDEGPHTMPEAHQLGLVDYVAYDDEVEGLLFEPQAKEEKEKDKTIRITKWDGAAKKMWQKWRPVHHEKVIAVVSLEGSIMMGESQNPPVELPIPIVGGKTAGDVTVVRHLRMAEQIDNLGALIFYVNSGGGSALSSDLMAREVERISKKTPVIIYQGDVAASGGYYVSAPGQHIMNQPGTITGSIGVVAAIPMMKGLLAKLKINYHEFKRGDSADLMNVIEMTDKRHDKIMGQILDIYKTFKWLVSTNRDIAYDELDPICLGRVWTGRQALEHKLVDSHGDFIDALAKARELADLPTDPDILVPVVNVYDQKKAYEFAKPFPNPAESINAVLNLPDYLRKRFSGHQLLMPFEIKSDL
ncbi:MAG: S49 family peptidase [Anaerolineae bacterium]